MRNRYYTFFFNKSANLKIKSTNDTDALKIALRKAYCSGFYKDIKEIKYSLYEISSK